MEVENIKRVSFARIRPKGDVVIITGGNGSGKSSILDGIEWAITGTSRIPTQPIKKGANFANIRIDFGDFRVTRHFARTDPARSKDGSNFYTKLILEGKQKEKFASPQALLDSFLGTISFDPLALLSLKPKDQVETLRAVAGLNLAELDKAIEEVYQKRRDAARELGTYEGLLKATPKPPEDLPEKEVDLDAIAREIGTAGEHNAKVRELLAQQTAKRRRAEELRAEAEAKRAQILRLVKEIEEADDLQAKMDKGADEMKIPAALDPAELTKRLQDSQKVNEEIRLQVTYRNLEKRVNDSKARVEQLDGEVNTRREARAAAIANAKLPLPGLSIGDGEVLFNDIPFSQISNAEQIKVSTALAMASNPKLRVLRIKDGSLLDDKSLAQIAEMATEQSYQVWVERVTSTGKVQVLMEDGEASGEDVEEVPARKVVQAVRA
jgi:energy-coupling factor transporter ATP-binding protein EcfA2